MLTSPRIKALALCGVAVASFFATLPARAQLSVTQTGTPRLAIPVPEFLANPNTLLARFPAGGALMISATRSLISADIRTLEPVVNLARTANDLQKSAIGAALGQLALMYATTNPQIATQIQEAVARLADQSLTAAYTSVTGDIATAAIGGGGGASAGAGGSPTSGITFGSTGGNSTPANLFGSPTATSPFSFQPITVVGAVGSIPSATTPNSPTAP